MKLRPELEQLLQTLQIDRALSAPELARRMKCSMPAVYRRLNALAREGVVIVEIKERRLKPGPTPAKYRLAQCQIPVPQFRVA